MWLMSVSEDACHCIKVMLVYISYWKSNSHFFGRTAYHILSMKMFNKPLSVFIEPTIANNMVIWFAKCVKVIASHDWISMLFLKYSLNFCSISLVCHLNWKKWKWSLQNNHFKVCFLLQPRLSIWEIWYTVYSIKS